MRTRSGTSSALRRKISPIKMGLCAIFGKGRAEQARDRGLGFQERRVESALPVVGLVVLTFAATNLDNLLLLVGIVSRVGQPFARVVAGTLLAAIVMLALCVGAALAADFAPQRWVGYLGFVPVALGLRELYRLAAARSNEAREPYAGAAPIPALGVAGVMLANSADSIGALLPLFAETRDALLPLISAVVLAASLLGCALARWIASHERLGPPIRRIAPRLVPIVLIAVGLYVLSDTGTDTLLDVPAAPR